MAESTFNYRKRIADILLEEKLEAMGAVLIEGPKACGKTTTAEQQARSILYMDDPANIQQNLQLAETNIKRLLQGDTPRLIDEWMRCVLKQTTERMMVCLCLQALLFLQINQRFAILVQGVSHGSPCGL